MERTSSSTLNSRRILILIWLALYVSWYWIAPALMHARGHYDEAAWLPLFLSMTMLGIVIGLCALAWQKWWLIALFAVATAIHVAVGLGMHPR